MRTRGLLLCPSASLPSAASAGSSPRKIAFKMFFFTKTRAIFFTRNKLLLKLRMCGFRFSEQVSGFESVNLSALVCQVRREWSIARAPTSWWSHHHTFEPSIFACCLTGRTRPLWVRTYMDRTKRALLFSKR
jgi:hypothetical protein